MTSRNRREGWYLGRSGGRHGRWVFKARLKPTGLLVRTIWLFREIKSAPVSP